MKKASKKIGKDHSTDPRREKDSIEDMIEQLTQCEPLETKQLKILCQKVYLYLFRRKKFL